ncbi:MAG TPA: serine/threonine-protein kinase [Bryobacteraceae bacterium]|nr:serine/threonine-protein kinase [Bryobacteraceae bacterium]
MTAPTQIGRYELIRRLGKGMTDVYLALDLETNLKTALKVIPAGGDATRQLIIEAELRGAAIQKDLHALDPRVVEIYDYGQCDGYFFVAMEYVEGRNLSEVLRSERALDPVRAATIALEICEQLAQFHSCPQAVVHGDIKPSNIHLGRSDTVRLLDFGIAKALRADGNATSHHFGSPGYCSPERLNRSEVDQQSDLWAVGATLYEMLAGVPPFQAENTRKLERLIRSKRAPRSLGPNCPRALRAVVIKALAPNPEQRYGSASAFQADLQAFLEHRMTQAEEEYRRAHGNSTIEAARACLRMATRTVRKAGERLRLGGAVAWFAVGMSLWILGTLAWEGWRARRVAAAFGAPATSARKQAAPQAPVTAAATPVKPAVAAPPGTPAVPVENQPQLYVAAAERIIDSYRKSSDASLHDFDWQKAEVCLEHAVELGDGTDHVQGELALSRGYATLERLSGGKYSAASLHSRMYARDQFALAAGKMPENPDPHLALARLFVYWLPSRERAMSEFAAAEKLGAVAGPREKAQKADAARLVRPRPVSAHRKRNVRIYTARRRTWR